MKNTRLRALDVLSGTLCPVCLGSGWLGKYIEHRDSMAPAQPEWRIIDTNTLECPRCCQSDTGVD